VNKAYAVVAVTGVVLAAIYLLWAYQRAMHGPPVIAGGATDHGGLSDLSTREWVILVPIMVMILFIGVFPKSFLDTIRPAVERTVACVRVHQLPPGLVALPPGIRCFEVESSRDQEGGP
jgi:NADH-quinone oxidoreductase subunit M